MSNMVHHIVYSILVFLFTPCMESTIVSIMYLGHIYVVYDRLILEFGMFYISSRCFQDAKNMPIECPPRCLLILGFSTVIPTII